MEAKIVTKKTLFFLLLFFCVLQFVNAQNDKLQDTCFIFFESSKIYIVKKYNSRYQNNKLKFNYIYENSLKSPLFIFDKSKNKKQILTKEIFDKLNFSDPYDTYRYYYESSIKPILYLIAFENNTYYKYQVGIEFPMPPPKPKPFPVVE